MHRVTRLAVRAPSARDSVKNITIHLLAPFSSKWDFGGAAVPGKFVMYDGAWDLRSQIHLLPLPSDRSGKNFLVPVEFIHACVLTKEGGGGGSVYLLVRF